MKLFSKKQKKEKPEVKEEKTVEEQAVLPSTPSLPKGGDDYSYQTILSPYITEKSSLLGESNKYLFKVAPGANKIEIKKAIEGLYKTKVDKVHVLYVPSKSRRVGKYEGRKSGFKKALITLKEGSKIDLAA